MSGEVEGLEECNAERSRPGEVLRGAAANHKMLAMPRHVPRYVPWSAPDSAPPLPLKKCGSAPVGAFGTTSESDAPRNVANGAQPVPSSAPSALSSKIEGGCERTGSYLNDSRFRVGDWQAASAGLAGSATSDDAKAVHEAIMMDASNWFLRNRETGQEVDATSFVKALVARCRTPQQTWSTSSPQIVPSGGGWISRRHRNNDRIVRRPTLLPPESGGMNDFALPPAHVGPASPPALQLVPGALNTSPTRARERSFLLEHSSSSCVRNDDDSGGRSHSGSSTTIVSASDSSAREFKLSKMSTAQILPQLHPGGIRAISFSPSGELLATAGADHRCFVFRVQQRRRSALGEGSSNAALATALAPAGEVSSGSQNIGPATTGRLISEEPMRTLSGHVGEVVSLSWASDDSVLLTASADGTVRGWRPLDGSECSCIYEHGGGVTSVAWDPASVHGDEQEGEARAGGGRFLTGCMDGKLRLFSVDSSEVEESVLAERPVTAVAFAPGGAAFVAGFVGGNVGFYRTGGLVRELTAECRRHGIRHSASQHARLAKSPVRRLSGSNSGRRGARGGGRGSVNGRGRGRRRRNTIGPHSGARRSKPVEDRVTGLNFRPHAKGAVAEPAGTSSDKSERGHRVGSSGDISGVEISGPLDLTGGGGVDGLVQVRAPAAGEEGDIVAELANGSDNTAGEDHAWGGAMNDLLVSTNDSRARVLVSGLGEGVTVGVKLKGHNTDGVLGWHTMARYSDDGELVVSGSADGNVHVWSTPSASSAGNTSRRAVAWSSGRERHEKMQVCDKTVAVPVALFAPRGIGRSSSRVILTGDDEGNLEVFYG